MGIEGNERADRLGDQGKASAGRQGTTAPAQPRDRTAPNFHGDISMVLKEKAQEHSAPTGIVRRKPWITETTLTLLAEAVEDAKLKRNQAKRSARKDKINWIHDQLTGDLAASSSTVWSTVRNQKRGFRARKTHLVVDSHAVPWSRNHTAFRDHHENYQWFKAPEADLRNQVLLDRPQIHHTRPEQGDFTLEELQQVIASLKAKKAPGPDGVPNELYKLLDQEAELALLQTYDQIRSNLTIQPGWLEAKVVTIFKEKGPDTHPGNYRPIALLNVVYKILAAMIQARLATTLDSDPRATQYGFRRHKGTQHPLFILRRAMEWANLTNRPLKLLFLDWKQAFDLLDHTAMITALRRFGVQDTELQLIRLFYTDATFQVHSQTGDVAKGAFN